MDEAGRGPVLGPLVVAAVAVEDGTTLEGMGLKDSKRLSPARREVLFDEIGSVCDIEVVSLPPQRIDEARKVMSLNALEAEAFAAALAPFRDHSLFVDCADANEKAFASTLKGLLGSCGQMVCKHRADEKYPVVSAASIVAKVTRDRAVRELEEEAGEPLGSGYPSDPVTISFLERWINDKGNPPSFARMSWQTTRRILNMSKNSRLEDWSEASTVMEALDELVDKFNNKVQKDDGLSEALTGIRKAINLDLGELEYSFRLEDGEAHSLSDGLIDEADVVISSDPDTILDLLEKRIRPMKAFAQRRFRVAGEIEDLLRLRKLF